VEEREDMCGPWILPAGDEFTHTASEASPIRPWNQTLSLNTLGVNTVIAHLRLGLVQFAVAHNVQVVPKAVKPVVPSEGDAVEVVPWLKELVPVPTEGYRIVTKPSNDTNCGDGYCDEPIETCKSCPADCCDSLLTLYITILVVCGVSIVAVGIILGIWYFRRRYYTSPSTTERLIAETNSLL